MDNFYLKCFLILPVILAYFPILVRYNILNTAIFQAS